MPPRYMTVTEAATELGISRRRVLKLIEDKRLRGAIKFGQMWMIPNKAVEGFERRPTGRPGKKAADD